VILIRFSIFIFTLLIWLLLNWSLSASQVAFGAVVGIVVVILTGDVFEPRRGAKAFYHPGRFLWLFCYVAVFIWECFKANLDGAWRVLHPDMPINPGIVKVRTNLKSDIGLTFLANSLTLKPGTMTVDIDKESGVLYIHWIDVKTQDIQKASELIVRRFETLLMRIFE